MQEITWKYGGAVSDEILRAVESKLGVVFPSDYRTVVVTHNGGRPRPNLVEIPDKYEAVLERLLRFDGTGGDDILSYAEVLKDRGQAQLVPFAIDPFGNFFCFQFARKSVNAVVYWDHEDGSVSRICKTFSELLTLLRPPRE